MALTLKRPLVFFDLETTGINITQDRIVEISYIKIMPNGEEISKTLRFNPGIPIPPEATEVHHITNEMVADKPLFKQCAKDLAKTFVGCDFAGFNSNRFDIPLLDEEFNRAGVDFDFSRARFVDVQTIFHKKEPRTLVAAYRFYCDKELEGAHSADADTRATYEVLKAQLEKYTDLEGDVESLSKFANQSRNVDLMGRLVFDDNGREIINFGRYKGKPAEEVLISDPGYFGWIDQGDFPGNTKRAFRRIFKRVLEAKKNTINKK